MGKKKLSATKEYKAWENMKSRCYNTKATGYKHYGNRGIKVCRRWRASFNAFLEDMDYAPSPYHTLDRIDVNGHYNKTNCRWATRKQQANNMRTTTMIDGRPLQHYAAKHDISPKTLSARVRRGDKDLFKKSKRYTFLGITDSLSGWAHRLHLPISTLFNRINRGMPYSKVFRSVRYVRR